MIITGGLAILGGWLMILSMHRKAPAPAPAQSRLWVRITLALVGTWLLAAGMATVVQARF
ncbi:MAG: hypothetical protein ABSB88_23565 [Bryobacteraceae bacterium]|jgi:hypothetical protein